MKSKVKSSLKLLPISSIRIDEYQRSWGLSDTAWVKEKSEVFDEAQFLPIIVSLRDGSYFAIDGQHRIMLGKNIKRESIMALVYEGLSKEQEAEYFNKLNGANGEIKRLRKTETHNASVVAKDKMAVDIRMVTSKHGFTIESSKRDNVIAAIASVERIYKKYGLSILDDALSTIRLAWNGDKKAVDGIMIEGVAEFIAVYKTDEYYDDRVLVKKLQKVAPYQITREALADTSASTKSARVVNVLYKYYNIKSRVKLPNKHYILS